MDKIESKRKLIASRLRLAREMAGLTQGQAAKLLGIHRPTLSEMEAGRRKVAAEEVSNLAKMYGVGVSWLVGEESEGADSRQDRIELAAREMGKLKREDLDRLLGLLKALRD
jgi:transcriptional regulator with XRE-family HTH domain